MRFFEKKFVICLVCIEKGSIFASAFRKKAVFKEAFFERFRYKQASSTVSVTLLKYRVLYRQKKKPSILNKPNIDIIDSLLEYRLYRSL